jgi:hypothetical protein
VKQISTTLTFSLGLIKSIYLKSMKKIKTVNLDKQIDRKSLKDAGKKGS